MASNSADSAERAAGRAAKHLLEVVPGEADLGVRRSSPPGSRGRRRAGRRAGSRRRRPGSLPGRGRRQAERALLAEHGDVDLAARQLRRRGRSRPRRLTASSADGDLLAPRARRRPGASAGPSSSTSEKNSSSVNSLRRASVSGGSWRRASGSKRDVEVGVDGRQLLRQPRLLRRAGEEPLAVGLAGDLAGPGQQLLQRAVLLDQATWPPSRRSPARRGCCRSSRPSGRGRRPPSPAARRSPPSTSCGP